MLSRTIIIETSGVALVEEEHFLPCPQNYIAFGTSFIILRTLINQTLKVIATMREFLGKV